MRKFAKVRLCSAAFAKVHLCKRHCVYAQTFYIKEDNQMKKRILASLLALCMFIAVAPISALAADPVTTEEELLAAVENGGEITLAQV